MTHSIEFLFDAASDRWFRDQWAALAAADLPSQGTHRASSNRPHVTALAARHIDPVVDDRLRELLSHPETAMPVSVWPGPLIILGRGAHRVLARSITPAPELLALQSAVTGSVHEIAGDTVGYPHCLPGRWTPHVTLARRMPPDRIGAALTTLAAFDDRDRAVDLVRIRRWDGDTAVETAL